MNTRLFTVSPLMSSCYFRVSLDTVTGYSLLRVSRPESHFWQAWTWNCEPQIHYLLFEWRQRGKVGAVSVYVTSLNLTLCHLMNNFFLHHNHLKEPKKKSQFQSEVWCDPFWAERKFLLASYTCICIAKTKIALPWSYDIFKYLPLPNIQHMKKKDLLLQVLLLTSN